MIHRVVVLSFMGLLLPVFYCSEQSTVGKGGASETVNAKLILLDSSVTAQQTDHSAERLELHPFGPDYRPFEQTGYAGTPVDNSSGTLLWQAPVSGRYNLLLTIPQSGASCFIPDIRLAPGTSDTVRCTLGPTRTLTGVLVHSDSSSITGQYVLSIYGSPFIALSDNQRCFSIPALPDGQFTLNVRSTEKRLFITTSRYTVATDLAEAGTRLQILVP